jgi:hypothetical protein
MASKVLRIVISLSRQMMLATLDRKFCKIWSMLVYQQQQTRTATAAVLRCQRWRTNGVEFAAELFDMLNEDLGRSFPKILRNEISVHLIQSRVIFSTLMMKPSRDSQRRDSPMTSRGLDELKGKEVRPDKILFTQRRAWRL